MRRPFTSRPDDDPGRLAELEAKGLGKDMVPKRFTDAEKLAAQNPGQEAPKELPMKPVIPVWLAAVSAALSPVLYLLSNVAPSPYGLLLFGLSFVAAFLGGLSLPVPKFMAGRAVLPAFLVPVVGSLVPVLVTLAQGMAEGGVARHAVELLAIVLTALAGLPVSVPTVKPAPAVLPPAPTPEVPKA